MVKPSPGFHHTHSHSIVWPRKTTYSASKWRALASTSTRVSAVKEISNSGSEATALFCLDTICLKNISKKKILGAASQGLVFCKLSSVLEREQLFCRYPLESLKPSQGLCCHIRYSISYPLLAKSEVSLFPGWVLIFCGWCVLLRSLAETLFS